MIKTALGFAIKPKKPRDTKSNKRNEGEKNKVRKSKRPVNRTGGRTDAAVTEWETNTREIVRVSTEIRDGQTLIRFGIFHRDEGGEVRPTRRQLTIPEERLRSALQDVEKARATAEGQADQSIVSKKRHWGADD